MPITHYTSPITFTSAPIPARHFRSQLHDFGGEEYFSDGGIGVLEVGWKA